MVEDKKCACHTEEKVRSGECCKQKANALDEFWHNLGDKKKVPMHSNAVLAGNPISALRTPKTFTDYSHSLILRVLRDRVFPVSNCQTTGTGT